MPIIWAFEIGGFGGFGGFGMLKALFYGKMGNNQKINPNKHMVFVIICGGCKK